MSQVKSEERTSYDAKGGGGAVTIPLPALASEDATIKAALQILRQRLMDSHGEGLTSPDLVRRYLTLRFAGLGHEVFAAIFLDTKHRVLACQELFRGTIDGATVHPREVAKEALTHNAAAIILAHNHPSGIPEPSAADKVLTQRLRETLALIDVRVLDHIIVGGAETVSFAERGLL